MRRSCWAMTLAISLCSLLCACGISGGSGHQPDELVVADFYADTHSIGQAGIQPYMKEIEKRSDGEIRFEYKTSEQVVAAEDTQWALRSGAADIGNVLYMDSQMPLMYVPQIPGLFSDDQVVAASRAFWNFIQTNDTIQDTFKEWNLHPIFCGTTTNYQLQFSDPNAGSTVESLEGKSVRAAGPLLPFAVEATGAVSTDLNASEAYDAFNRGVIDGVTLSATSMRDYSYYELIESAVVDADLGGFPICYAMNLDTWKNLDPEQQRIFNEVGAKTVERTARTLLGQLDSEIDQWRKDGIKIHHLGHPKQIQRRLSKIEQRWVDALVDNGMDRAAVEQGIAQWKRLLAKEIGR